MTQFQIWLFLLCICVITFFSCNQSDLENLCDPKSDQYKDSLLLRYINFDESPHCGVVLKVNPPTYLICPPLIPKRNGTFFLEAFETDGNRLSFSSNPPLPPGVVFSFFSNSLEGTYNGWKANQVQFTITASNPKGSASCVYKPAWMGKTPPKTNITVCYDGSGNIDATCTVIPGQDGHLRKGINTSFVGPTLVSGVEITTDLVTGLVWTSCHRGRTGIGCITPGTETFTYTGAQTECTSLNAGSGFADRTDWRVPEMEEYLTTFDHTTENPSTNSTYFPQTASFNYKSNTSNAASTGAFYPTYIQSSIGFGNYTDMHYLRCVATPRNTFIKRFIDQLDGTILDLDSGLLWQKCTAGQPNVASCSGGTDSAFVWSAAINYCQNLSLAGKTWRLPNANELISLKDYRFNFGTPGFNSLFFPNTASASFWSSSPVLGSPSTQAYVTDFGGSGGGPTLKSDGTVRTRCVTDY